MFVGKVVVVVVWGGVAYLFVRVYIDGVCVFCNGAWQEIVDGLCQFIFCLFFLREEKEERLTPTIPSQRTQKESILSHRILCVHVWLYRTECMYFCVTAAP